MNGAFPNPLAVALVCVVFLIAGIVALIWPEEIQRHILRFHAGAKGIAAWNPWLDWMRTPSYVATLRLIGVVSLAIALGGAFLLGRHVLK